MGDGTDARPGLKRDAREDHGAALDPRQGDGGNYDNFDELKTLAPGAVNGKILLLNHPFDNGLTAQGEGLAAYGQGIAYRGYGAVVGARLGAAAVLVRSIGNADFRLPHTGATRYTENVPRIPTAAITAEDADQLASLSKQGPVTMRLVLTPQTLPDTIGYNVIADWKGSKYPEQVIIVSGHLDSWDLGTGAIDDGSGVAEPMETIQLLATGNIHPKRTVRFIAWMSEEFGAQGAATYAADHADEVDNHIAAMESDLGCDHPAGLIYAGSPALAEYLRPIAHTLAPIHASLIAGSEEEDTSDDNVPLTDKGVPGITLNEDLTTYFNYHHTAADTFDKVTRTCWRRTQLSWPSPRTRWPMRRSRRLEWPKSEAVRSIIFHVRRRRRA